MEETNQTNPYLIPAAIVIAGAFIGAAVILTSFQPANKPVTAQQLGMVGSTDKVAPITSEDHIKGNPDAPIKIVEYSDFECPFCKVFHDTMNQIMDKYGDSGEVAWVFRQSPIESLHPVKAYAVAVASECVAELGGNDAFWAFTDGYFDVTLTNNRTNVEVVIPQLVKELGIDQTAFQTCFDSGKYDSHIEADIANSRETGGGGTPWSILIGPDGATYPINGAQKLATVEQLINLAKKSQ